MTWRGSLAGMLVVALLLGGYWWRFGQGPDDPAVSAPDPHSTESGFRNHPLQSQAIFESLRSEGLSLEAFLRGLSDRYKIPLTWESAGWEAQAAEWKFWAYDGNGDLTLPEALDLASFLGIRARPVKDGPGFRLGPNTSSELLWERLTSDVNPDDPGWGALRPWRSLRLGDRRTWGEILAAAQSHPGSETLIALGRALRGTASTLRVGSDGALTREYEAPPGPDELRAAEKLLSSLVESPAGTGEPAQRAVLAWTLGEFLALHPETQLPADHPLLKVLSALAGDADSETACQARLALGENASVAALAVLTEQALDERAGSIQRAAALTAIGRAEAQGRRLDAEALGAPAWERRRSLYARLQQGLAERAARPDASDWSLEESAAWWRLAEVLAMGPGQEHFIQRLRDRLWTSGRDPARLVMAALDGKRGRPLLGPLPEELLLAQIAGPLYHRSELSYPKALEAFSSPDRRLRQAAAWRLTRPETPRAPLPPEHAQAAPDLAARLFAMAGEDASPILRRLALQALYRDRIRPGMERAEWRLWADLSLAAKLLRDDPDEAVQEEAAEVLGRRGDPADFNALAAIFWVNRSPAAAVRLVTALSRRWRMEEGKEEHFTAAARALLSALGASGKPEWLGLSRWGRIFDPGMDSAAKVQLVRSIPEAGLRARGVAGLAEVLDPQADIPLKWVELLIGDEAPEVRSAVFASGLAGRVKGADRETLFKRGQADPDERVRQAAANANTQK